MISSKLCTFRDFEQPWYRDALCELREGFTLHRKPWEFACIAQVLRERGMLRPGKSGLGFAVGTEPLPSLLASHGVHVLATDQAPSEQAEKAWGANQLCYGLERLNARGLCEPAQFADRCRFRHVDMNALPEDLPEFDFLWSSCAFEHLGSLGAGLAFVTNALRYLKPGGVAVHTTEFNLSSDDATVDRGGSVFYRKRDLEHLEEILPTLSCRLEPIDYDRGDHPVDRIVDAALSGKPPHCHLKLHADGYDLTSVLLVITRD